jgi:hypothetical protein
MYWQYTTAPAGVGLRVTLANPRTLAAIPANVTDLIERCLLRHIEILLIALTNKQSRFGGG